MEWYYVWWPWMTCKCVARVCQHQLSFLSIYPFYFDLSDIEWTWSVITTKTLYELLLLLVYCCYRTRHSFSKYGNQKRRNDLQRTVDKYWQLTVHGRASGLHCQRKPRYLSPVTSSIQHACTVVVVLCTSRLLSTMYFSFLAVSFVSTLCQVDLAVSICGCQITLTRAPAVSNRDVYIYACKPQ